MLEALADDLNTPKAIAELHALHDKGDVELRVNVDAARARLLAAAARAAARSMSSKVNALIEARNAARKAKNFKEADRIRDELKAMGIELEDKKDGTTSGR